MHIFYWVIELFIHAWFWQFCSSISVTGNQQEVNQLLCVQVRALQTELTLEQKKSEEYQKGVRRYERKVKELTYQVWGPHCIQLLLSYRCWSRLLCFHWIFVLSCSQRRTKRLCSGCRSWLKGCKPKWRATRDKLRTLWVFRNALVNTMQISIKMIKKHLFYFYKVNIAPRRDSRLSF